MSKKLNKVDQKDNTTSDDKKVTKVSYGAYCKTKKLSWTEKSRLEAMLGKEISEERSIEQWEKILKRRV